MRLAKATLINRLGIFNEDIPLGKVYRVDLDTLGHGVLENLETGECRSMEAVLDVDEGAPLPRLALHIEGLDGNWDE